MTDNEIIKAKSMLQKLEEAYEAYYDTSKGMPFDIDVTLRETAICLENSLDEITRQKAEIERLKTLNSKLEAEVYNYKNSTLVSIFEKAKAEAIKEFAEIVCERLEKARQKYQRLCKEQGEKEDEAMNIHYRGQIKIVKGTVKEMVGEDV